MLTDSAILKKIQRQAKQTAGYKQLVRKLGLRGDERRQLHERLQNLISAGQLVQVDSDRYAIPQAASGKNLLTGKLSLHRDGFGFVIPDLSSTSGDLKSRISGDIFIPPHAVGSAMHGDRVLVEVTNIRDAGRAEGRILRPVDRAHATVVGIFHHGSRHNYVTPMDQKITQQIVIPQGMETLKNSSLVVGRSSLEKAQDADVGGDAKKKDAERTRRFSRPTNNQRPTTGSSKHRVLGEETARPKEWSD